MKHTLRTWINTVRRVAKERPDVTYQRPEGMGFCQYDKGKCSDGTIGCIFGQISKILDVPFGDSVQPISALIGNLQGTPQQLQWLTLVQRYQDGGSTWRQSVEYADSCIQLEGTYE